MSLFTDLKEVLTPYASRIKNLDNQVSEVNESLDDVKVDLDALEPGLSADAKTALLRCLSKVAWIDGNGRNYYNALAIEFDERHLPITSTWLYDATDGELLAGQNYVSVVDQGSATSETLINDQLVISTTPPESGTWAIYKRYNLTDGTTNAQLSVRAKFSEIATGSVTDQGAEGFRLQLSNGISGAQVFMCNVPDYPENFGICCYEGSNRQYVDLSAYDMNKYHVVTVELKNGVQTVYVDGTPVFTSNILSTNYCTSNSILSQRKAGASPIYTIIDWIAYSEVE